MPNQIFTKARSSLNGSICIRLMTIKLICDWRIHTLTSFSLFLDYLSAYSPPPDQQQWGLLKWLRITQHNRKAATIAIQIFVCCRVTMKAHTQFFLLHPKNFFFHTLSHLSIDTQVKASLDSWTSRNNLELCTWPLRLHVNWLLHALFVAIEGFALSVDPAVMD